MNNSACQIVKLSASSYIKGQDTKLRHFACVRLEFIVRCMCNILIRFVVAFKLIDLISQKQSKIRRARLQYFNAI